MPVAAGVCEGEKKRKGVLGGEPSAPGPPCPHMRHPPTPISGNKQLLKQVRGQAKRIGPELTGQQLLGVSRKNLRAFGI